MKLKIFQCRKKSAARLRMAVCTLGAAALIFTTALPLFDHTVKDLILEILRICGFMFF